MVAIAAQVARHPPAGRQALRVVVQGQEQNRRESCSSPQDPPATCRSGAHQAAALHWQEAKEGREGAGGGGGRQLRDGGTEEEACAHLLPVNPRLMPCSVVKSVFMASPPWSALMMCTWGFQELSSTFGVPAFAAGGGQ